MRRTLLFLCIAWMVSFFMANAENVGSRRAYEIASRFVSQWNTHQLKSAPSLHEAYICTDTAAVGGMRSSEVVNYYYVYNVGNKDGFVIIAGDDRAYPVLGYATQGTFHPDDMPEGRRLWLDDYKQQIAYVVQSGQEPSVEVRKLWKAIEDPAYASPYSLRAVVAPLLTSQWGQRSPFNNECPISGNNHALTGCVATAMAQIMYFHRYPVIGQGSHRYQALGQTVSADFSIGYDWANMLNSYQNGYTTAQATAVATLMFHCGVSCNMNYGIQSSSANMQDAAKAMMNYFKYDKGMLARDRDYYTEEEWEDLIQNELDNRRPVLYSGRTAPNGGGEGHTFVCDGYNGNSFFHINWGWNGSQNEYYRLSAFNTTDGNFTYDHKMIVAIQPDAGSSPVTELIIRNSNGFRGMTKNVVSVEKNVPFQVSVGIIFNMSLNDFSGKIGIALTDESGNIRSVMGIRNVDLSSRYFFNNALTFNCMADVEAGSSDKLVTVYLPSGSDNWQVMPGAVDVTDALPAVEGPVEKAAELYIGDVVRNGIRYNFNIPQGNTIVPGDPFSVYFALTNKGKAFNGQIKLVLTQNNMEKQVFNVPSTIQVDGYEQSIMSGALDGLKINNDINPGNYELKIWYKDDKVAVWSLVNDNGTSANLIPIEVANSVIIGDFAELQLSQTVANGKNYQFELDTDGPVKPGDPFVVNYCLVNNGNASYENEIKVQLFRENTCVEEVGSQWLVVAAGSSDKVSGSITCRTVQAVDGDYTLKLFFMDKNDEWQQVKSNGTLRNDLPVQLQTPVDPPTGLEELEKNTALSVSFNRESGEATVRTKANVAIESVLLYDTSGKFLQQIKGDRQNQLTISLGSYPDGIYLFVVNTTAGKSSRMLVK